MKNMSQIHARLPLRTRRTVLSGVLLLQASALTPTFSQNATWFRVTELPASSFYVCEMIDGILRAADDSCAYRSTDGGQSWVRSSPLPPDGQGFTALTVHGGWLYGGTFAGGVVRSADEGTHWTHLTAGLSTFGATQIQKFTVRNDTLFCGTGGGAYRWSESAATWILESDSLLTSISGAVAALTTFHGTLVVGSGANGAVYWRPSGQSWWTETIIRPPAAPGLGVTDLAVWNDSVVASTNNGVYVSGGDLRSWSARGYGSLHGLWAYLAVAGDSLYLAMNGPARLAVSVDGFSSWQLLSTLSGVEIRDLAVAGSRVYAARSDGLFWTDRSIASHVTGRSTPSGLTLHPAYPNPVNGPTVVSFTLPVRSGIRLAVHDLLGRTVAVLAEREFPEGTHRVSWEAAVASGLYVVTLDASVPGRSGALRHAQRIAVVR